MRINTSGFGAFAARPASASPKKVNLQRDEYTAAKAQNVTKYSRMRADYAKAWAVGEAEHRAKSKEEEQSRAEERRMRCICVSWLSRFWHETWFTLLWYQAVCSAGSVRHARHSSPERRAFSFCRLSLPSLRSLQTSSSSFTILLFFVNCTFPALNLSTATDVQVAFSLYMNAAIYTFLPAKLTLRESTEQMPTDYKADVRVYIEAKDHRPTLFKLAYRCVV